MKKGLWIFLCFAVGAILISAYFFNLRRAHILEEIISDSIEIPVKIKKIELKKNGLEIHDLKIENPDHGRAKYCFTAEKVSILFNWKKCLSTFFGIEKSPLLITNMKVKDCRLFIDFFSNSPSENSLRKLYKLLSTQEEPESGLPIKIKKLEIINTKLIWFSQKQVAFNLPTWHPLIKHIELKNLGFEKPLSAKPLAATILKSMADDASSELGFDLLAEFKMPKK